MPEGMPEVIIPDEFVDYRRRLIAYTESDTVDREFLLLSGELRKQKIGFNEKVMKFRLGNTDVQVFYLDEGHDVGEVISRVQPLVANITLERDVRMVALQQTGPDPL